MAQRCEKVVLRFACFFGCDLFRFHFAGANLICNIARDFRKATNVAPAIAQRLDDDFRVKSRSIFANAESLVPIMSLAGCFAQVALRLFVRNILRRVEAGKVFSNDFVCCVLLDFFGA